MALVLPGTGQLYNRQSWKLPVVLGVFFGVGYYVDYRHKLYSYVETSLHYATDDDPETENSLKLQEAADLENRIQRLRRERDLSLIIVALTYALQAIEAHVSAHLMNFDSDTRLTLQTNPFYEPTPKGPVAGLSLQIGFNNPYKEAYVHSTRRKY